MARRLLISALIQVSDVCWRRVFSFFRCALSASRRAFSAASRVRDGHAGSSAFSSRAAPMAARVRASMRSVLALQPDPPRCPVRTRLAALTVRRDGLMDQLKKEKTRLHQAMDSFVRKDIRSMILVLEGRIKKIEAEITRQIAEDEHLSRLDAQLQSAPGIGKVISALLIARLPELGQVNRRAIASLAGLAPHAHDSGYMKGKRRIWGGRSEVRSALYLAAFVASQHDPDIKAERTRLQTAGKPFKVTIIALARRLLTRLNAMIKENRIYRLKHEN